MRHQPAAPRPGQFRRHLPALIVFIAATVLLTWPLALRMNDTLISWGDPVFQSWTIGWNWHALRTDPLAIYDANVFYPWGNTLAYSDHLFGQTLSVLPIIGLTGNGILADNVATLLAFVLSAVAMYFLVYDLTGNRVAAGLAGVAYAFAPSRVAHLEHLHLLSAQWPPLMLLCLRRAIGAGSPPIEFDRWKLGRRGDPLESEALLTPVAEPRAQTVAKDEHRAGWLFGLGACFFAQGLFGIYFLYFSVIMLLVAGAIYFVFAVVDRDWRVARTLGLAAMACAIAGALLVPTLLPYWQVNQELNIERSEEEVSFWSAEPEDYLAVWPRARFWNGLLEQFHTHLERALFPGLFLLTMAGVGLLNRDAGRQRWVLLGVTLGGVLMSFGLSVAIAGLDIPLPYQAFYDWLPGFRAIRVPARLGLIALVGLAGLAGLGVDRIWRLARDELPLFRRYPDVLAKRPTSLALLTGGLSLVFVLLETVPRMELPDRLPAPPDEALPVYVWIRDNPGPTLELPMGEGPVASAWPNFWSMFHWNETVNGYSGIVPPTYYPLRERMREFPSDETIRLMQGIGVTNVIIHADAPDRAALDARLAATRQLRLRVDGPDAVYTLAADPWMLELAAAVPDGAPVDLPEAGSDPVAFGLLMAILQRDDHAVTGAGEIDRFRIDRADDPVCFVVLPTGAEPADHNLADASEHYITTTMTLYARPGCLEGTTSDSE